MFYAVKVGMSNNTIYTSWEECKANVSGVSGAIYKKFNTLKDAEAFLDKPLKSIDRIDLQDNLIAYVDGSYNSVEKETGYGIVFVNNNKIVSKDMGRVLMYGDNTTNNVLGELIGALKATELAIANGYKEIVIAHDYLGISAWVTGDWKPRTEITRKYRNTMIDYSSKIKLNFLKIKAHSDEQEGGSIFNHEADRLAKLASGIL